MSSIAIVANDQKKRKKKKIAERIPIFINRPANLPKEALRNPPD